MQITLVTVAYDQQAYVEAALRSVVEQGYPDLQYIVVDPGSTDGTREIIERYSDRIDHMLFRPDHGPADGLNKGFALATGEIYGFINSDDLLMPGALSAVARAFQADPQLDLLMGHMWIIDGKGRRVRRAYTDRFAARAYAYGSCTICQQATFFRASLFERVGGFNAENCVAWDSELFLDMMEHARGHLVLDEILSAFRIHALSITGSRRQREDEQRYFHQRFERIMGRTWRRSDALVRLYYLARKYVMEPRSLRERLLRGSILSRTLITE